MIAVLRGRNLLARLLLWRDFTPFTRVHFLAAAAESGVLRALREPLTAAELAEKVDVRRPELLEALLAVGVALGELATEGQRYSLRGPRARLIASGKGDAFAALVEEWMHYDADVFRELEPRLRGAALGDYLAPTATIVARSSRVLEPFVSTYLRALVARRRPRRVLDVGCGSGVYLKHAAEASPDVTGVGIDLDRQVVDLARKNVSAWGIADRFEIVAGDARRETPSGPFDLITLFNNIYYFAPEERVTFFRRLAASIAPGGALAVVTATAGPTVAIRAFDLVLQSTEGCWALPSRDALVAQLRDSGFGGVRRDEIAAGQSLDAFLAT